MSNPRLRGALPGGVGGRDLRHVRCFVSLSPAATAPAVAKRATLSIRSARRPRGLPARPACRPANLCTPISPGCAVLRQRDGAGREQCTSPKSDPMAEGVGSGGCYLYSGTKIYEPGNTMEHDASPEGQPPPAPGSTSAAPVSRRGMLLRAGLKASPVLMTLASRPVMAATCQTASAVASAGSPGRVVAPVAACNGIGPATLQSSWTTAAPTSSASAASPSTTFTSVFPGISIRKPGATFSEVLRDAKGNIGGTTSQQNLAKNLVAAYANYLSGATDPGVLPLNVMQRAWSTGYNSQFLVAGSATKWTPDQINAWLTKMFASA